MNKHITSTVVVLAVPIVTAGVEKVLQVLRLCTRRKQGQQPQNGELAAQGIQ
jgi:hypothetical protein